MNRAGFWLRIHQRRTVTMTHAPTSTPSTKVTARNGMPSPVSGAGPIGATGAVGAGVSAGAAPGPEYEEL
ncbi:MAG TPA: hypothetical protein ENN85_08185 [Methanoculleus sp.]|nr:hypothetical protein [Methanoculleus sp.]